MADNQHFCMQCMLETDRKETVCPYCGYPVNSKQPKPYLPQGILIRERYLVGKMIKRNTDSAIYIGRDTERNKTVEIREFFPAKVSKREEDMKTVSPGEGYDGIYREYLVSFIQLWRNLMRFKGLPALFEVSDVFEENSTAYAVTDHNDSTTFRKILDTMNVEENPFSLKRTQTLIMSILSTVESLHTANVVHRGISPETLVLSSDGMLKITGFSIPQVRTTKNTIINSVCDGYAAIEQYDFNWQQGSWTDIYSIGALIYKMLTGRTLPSAPARLNDEEVFFTDEETERIPKNIIELIKECLVLMPQGRIKDIHDIINVFIPQEASKKTVSTVRSRPAAAENDDDVKIYKPENKSLRADGVMLSGADKTKTKPLAVSPQQQKFLEKKAAELEKQEQHGQTQRPIEKFEQEQLQAEKIRRQREEEIRQRNLASQKTASPVTIPVKAVPEKPVRRIQKKENPVTLAVGIAAAVSVGCILLTFILYGTVLYKYVDAPVLDNCLSPISFLPVNSENAGSDDIEYVDVPDFRNLTREYIENDALYNKKYNIEYEYDWCDTVEKGYVFSQSISEGNQVEEGTTITVYISKGIEMLKFVDVKDKQYDEAEKLLTEIGFKVVKKEIYNIGLYTQGKVISASLDVGDEYPRGTEVTLSVWGTPPVTLPSTTQSQSESPSQQSPFSPGQNDNDRPDFFSFWRDVFGF